MNGPAHTGPGDTGSGDKGPGDTAPSMGRRTFLAGMVAGIGLGLAGCGSGDSDDEGSGDGGSGDGAAPLTELDVAGPVFTLGVASGDPLHDRVILWTRLAPEPLVAGGGMPDRDVAVDWEVATDDSFEDVVSSGTATATPALAHTVHVDAGDLEPDTWYRYRFRVGDELSAVGRTRTFPAPDASPERLRLAVANCQDYQTGRYAAYRDLVEQDLDVVLFLGDYIYEEPGLDDPAEALERRAYPGGEPESLDDYRSRYAITRLDPQLRAAHESLPWIVTFDDHEVENNYAGDVPQPGTPSEGFAERRAAAYQAWYEHLPLRIDPPAEDGSLEVHRASSFGDLARLFVVETRQHADEPPCRDTAAFDTGPGCDEQQDPDRTALGEEQAAWLLDGMAENLATWQVLVNPILLAGLDISSPEAPPSFFLETWDGYPAERARLASGIIDRGVRNPVVLSGDYHASFVAEVRADPWDLSSPVAAPELLGTAISSIPFPADYTAANPHISYFDARNGYLTCEVTPQQITAEFRYVEDVSDADSPVTLGATFVVRPAEDGGAPTVSRV